MMDMRVPAWAGGLLGAGAIAFVVLVALYIKRGQGVRRSLFSMPYGLWMALFTILPCVLIGYYALTDANGAFTLENFSHFFDSNFEKNRLYAEMAKDTPELQAFIRRGTVNVDTLVYSLWMAFLCTVICLVLGYPAAFCMADRGMRMGSTVVILFIVPMWMNFLLRTIAWMSLLEDNGLINNLLSAMGFGRLQLMYNTGAVLLGMVYNYLPFMVFPIYNALNKQDVRLHEAAMDLGASPVRTFARVTLPLSVPGIISGITMVFMPSVTTFFIPRILGGGNTMMFGDLIESKFLTEGDWNVGSALSMIMMVMILISLSILRKADPEGEGGSMI